MVRPLFVKSGSEIRIFLADSLLLSFFLRNRFIGSLLSIPLINTVYHLLVNNNKGEERGEEGGLIRERGSS